MTRSTRIILGDILRAARLTQQYADGMTFEEFELDTEKQDAVARRIEIIGEAVKQLPVGLRESYPDVPWREIAGARDILVHEYFRIDLELAWDMVQADIPELISQIESILDELAE